MGAGEEAPQRSVDARMRVKGAGRGRRGHSSLPCVRRTLTGHSETKGAVHLVFRGLLEGSECIVLTSISALSGTWPGT